MLKYLRPSKNITQGEPDPAASTLKRLSISPELPITIRLINELPDNAKQRIYRSLIPRELLSKFGIDPITWKGPDNERYVTLKAETGGIDVYLEARSPFDPEDPFFAIELSDNKFNRMDLNLLILSDPNGQRFATDIDGEGRATLFGTMRRNLVAEEKAALAGLAPGQIRRGLRGSAEVLHQLDTFLNVLGHRSLSLEPLTYSSAWLFERRGYAYIQGHQLMDQIHREFQPGGLLHAALDESSPFRTADQWQTVRGRAWAIHDGILEVLGANWDGLRMVRQVGHRANVNTFPDAVY
ncbi:MAG TPA: hypothetical protein VFI27_18610 [candidate division Zixibacteria bacterium]|nr:hypothetical protein [candidate division Zixibacteria bacterium]